MRPMDILAQRVDSPRLRIVSLDEVEFLSCLEHGVWGATYNRFRLWRLGDLLVFKVSDLVAGLAEVTGTPFHQYRRVWDNGTFPYRIAIGFSHAFLHDNRPRVEGRFKEVLAAQWGSRWGWGVHVQAPIVGEPAQRLRSLIVSHHNDISDIRANLQHHQSAAQIRWEEETWSL